MTISERLFDIMDSKNLRAIELAHILNVNGSVISMWKKRNTAPPSDYLIQICGFLEVPVEYLLTGKFPQNQQPTPLSQSALSDDERDLLAMYSHLDEAGKKIARYAVKGIVEGSQNLSSSQDTDTSQSTKAAG